MLRVKRRDRASDMVRVSVSVSRVSARTGLRAKARAGAGASVTSSYGKETPAFT